MMTPDSSCRDEFDPSSTDYQQAVSRIVATVSCVNKMHSVPVTQALGRIAACDVMSELSVPSFRASSMDGYALRAESAAQLERSWLIRGQSLAGHPFFKPLGEYECVRITTGAYVPDDADRVVIQENTRVDGDQLHISEAAGCGDNIRLAGSNVRAGDTLISAGQRIKASTIGLLASTGVDTVPVRRQLRVAVFSTGDELTDSVMGLGPGKILDSNRQTLLALLQGPNIIATDLGIVPDTLDDLTNTIDRCQAFDLVLSTGGVSVGDADFVREALGPYGDVRLWKIAVKPGRPLTHATLTSGTQYFGLPGNPVSSTVTFDVFVRPVIDALLGKAPKQAILQTAQLTTDIKKSPGRLEFQRGVLSRSEAIDVESASQMAASDAENHWYVKSTGAQDSHILKSAHLANCYIVLSKQSNGVASGEKVLTIPFSNYEEPL